MIDVEIKNKVLLVFWDKQLVKTVPEKPFAKHLKKAPSFVKKEEFLMWLNDLEIRCAKRYVLYLLSRCSYLSETLREKMLQKGYSDTAVNEVLILIERYSYIDDNRYLEKYIQQEIQKGSGPYLIYQKLRAKKIEECEIKKHIDQICTLDSQMVAMQKVIQKNKHKTKEKQVALLYRRGFSLETIHQFLGTLF